MRWILATICISQGVSAPHAVASDALSGLAAPTLQAQAFAPAVHDGAVTSLQLAPAASGYTGQLQSTTLPAASYTSVATQISSQTTSYTTSLQPSHGVSSAVYQTQAFTPAN